MKILDRNDLQAFEKSLSLTFLIQEAIKIATAVLLVLLSFRGLMAFYGAKESSWLEHLIHFATAPVLLPFQGLFTDSKAGEIPVFFSMLCVVFLGALLYVLAGLAGKYSIWVRISQKKALISAQKVQNQP